MKLSYIILETFNNEKLLSEACDVISNYDYTLFQPNIFSG